MDANERVILGKSPDAVVVQHIARYHFATQYCTGKTCLDLACGSGYGSEILIKAGASSVVGGDLSIECVEHARAHYGANEGVTFMQLNCEAIALPSGSVDIVTSFETIEHVGQPEKAVAEYCRVLRPTGLLIMSTPNPLSSCFPYGWLRAKRRRPNNRFHVQELTLSEIKRLLAPYFMIIGVFEQNARPSQKHLWLSTLAIAKPWRRQQLYRLWHEDTQSTGPDVRTLSHKSVPDFWVVVCRKWEC